MRFSILILLTAFLLGSASVGCGPKTTEPKAINIKEDPRIQRTTPAGGKGSNEGAVPGN